MAEKPDDRVLKVHPDVKDAEGNLIADEVSRAEFEGVWKSVGWTLQSKSKEK